MDKILKYLEQLDLSEIEAKLYVTLLQTGPTSVRDIATAIGIKRTTAYLYIEQLMQKGLIIKVVKGAKTQIAPTKPEESLEYLMDTTVKKARNLEEEFPEVLKDIKTNFPNFKEVDQFEIKYYKGVSGIRKIYEDALSANEFRSYVKMIEDDEVFMDNVGMFENAFKKTPKLTVKEILYKSSSASKEAQQIISINDRYAYKFMPEGMKLTSEDILIYDGKVAIIHYRGKQNCNSVVLHSIDYYNNSTEFFDFIWKMIPAVIV